MASSAQVASLPSPASALKAAAPVLPAGASADAGLHPALVKTTRVTAGNGLTAAVSSMQGRRPEMEDCHTVAIGLTLPGSHTRSSAAAVAAAASCAFFAVFDGHGGSLASKFGADHLLPAVTARPEFAQAMALLGRGGLVTAADATAPSPAPHDEPPAATPPADYLELLRRALVGGYMDTDAALRAKQEAMTSAAAADSTEHSGSTAVCALVTPAHILVANAGDSRAVLVKTATVQPLSSDHKPTAPGEAERITAAGSELTRKTERSVVRIDGNLAVSRGLGDARFKSNPNLPPRRQAVSAEPDVRAVSRDGVGDEGEGGNGSGSSGSGSSSAGPHRFVVLACDGVWDVASNKDVAAFVQSRAASLGIDATGSGSGNGAPMPVEQRQAAVAGLAEGLLDFAYGRDTGDNLSVVVVALPAAWGEAGGNGGNGGNGGGGASGSTISSSAGGGSASSGQ